jgi:hypothetical protein
MKKITPLFFLCILMLNYAIAQNETPLINQAMDSAYHLKPADFFISSQHSEKASGITYVYLQQRNAGIPVFNSMTNIAIKNNKVEYMNSRFTEITKIKKLGTRPGINAKDAVNFALKHLKQKQDPSLRELEANTGSNKYSFNAGLLSNKPVTVELMYVPNNGAVQLAWNVSIDLKGQSHWWNVRVDASTGDYIGKNDYVANCVPPPPVSPSYRVFAFPLEAPTYGSRTLLIDPADVSASPYGWHDDNGIIGPEYTITEGNNVYAYEDENNDDLPGYSPDGTPSLVFDFPYNYNSQPSSNRDAALTNLFYANNSIHDYLSHFGFTEAAGNFQQKNYSNQGTGNDRVLAEGFDGSGFDNANFATPPDGNNPRMQMYLWDGAPCGGFTVNSPALVAGSYQYGGAEFNPVNASVTANLVLVDDGTALPTQGCSPIINNIAGKIAVIDRGSCTFISKVLSAQAAGAAGVIIVNNVAGYFNMSGIDPSITIPSVMVSQADGNAIKAAMLSGTVNATIVLCPNINSDSNFDNVVMAHEYGHGVSNRLTGGLANTGCLYNAENGGEGWSDFFGLITTLKATDNEFTPRTVGSYLVGQTPPGFGIREYPYTTDMNVNPHTYAGMAVFPETHYVGEFWCAMIWDMTWKLINTYGYNVSPTNTTSGNNIALRLVMEGLKLQPCGPGFVDQRDAILLADHLLYNDAHRCLIWQAFARRGLGANAQQGDPFVVGDEVEDFSMPGITPYVSGGGSFCLPANTILDAGSGWNSYHWNTGATSQSIVPSAFGTYTVIVTGIGCSGGTESGSGTMSVYPNFTPLVTATPPSVCPHGNSNLEVSKDAQVGGSKETNTPGSSPAPYGDWYTSQHEQYLILASELTAAGLVAGNITGIGFDVVQHNSGPGSQNLQISIAPTNVANLGSAFISAGMTQVVSNAIYTSTVGWNKHTFSAPFNWNGVSNVVIDISMQNCTTCPAQPCVEYYFNDIVHISNTPFLSCSYANNDYDCTTPSFTPATPVTPISQRPNIKFFGQTAPVTYLWNPSTYLNNTHISNPTASNISSTINYAVTVIKQNGCVATGTQTVTVTIPPAAPASISGIMQACKGQTGMQFCISGDAIDAGSYQWTFPAGMTGVVNGNGSCVTVNANTKFKGGQLCVRSANQCYQSAYICTTIALISQRPGKPGNISGQNPVCSPDVYLYCIPAVATASDYVWSVTGTSAASLSIVFGQGTNCVYVDVPVGYNGQQSLSVKANNCKGLSDERKIVIATETIPQTPGTISGPASVCKNSTKSYSVPAIPNAITYNWTITGGATINSGQGTRNINVKFNTAVSLTPTLSVTATNVCGTSLAMTKAIVVNPSCKEADDNITSTGQSVESMLTFPNPTSNKVMVQFESITEERFKANVVDMTGRTLYSYESTAVNGLNEFEVDLTASAAGIYTVVINKGNSILKQIVVKN